MPHELSFTEKVHTLLGKVAAQIKVLRSNKDASKWIVKGVGN